MKYKIRLLVMMAAALCLLLVQNASASYTTKSLYIDGQHITDVNGGDTLDFTSGVIRLAAEGGDGYIYNEYIGKVAEFAVYSGLLNASRILAHYSAKDSNNAYTAAVQQDNPLLWLRFQDASADSDAAAKNSGSSTTNGRYFLTGSVSPMSIVQGINADSNALYIPDSGDGSAGHKVEVLDNGEFGSNLNGQVTVEIWVNFTAISLMSGNDYSRFYTTAGAYGLHLNNDSNTLVIHGGGENYVDIPMDINDGQWHHIVVTYKSVYQAPALPSTQAYSQEVAADNPVVWLRFNDSTPRDYAADGNNHWVSYGSAASIVEKSGGVGKAVLLNGTSGSGVYGVAVAGGPNAPVAVNSSYQIFDNNYAFTPNDITFEMWYKTLPTGQAQPDSFATFFQQVGTYQNEPCAPAASNSGGQIRIYGGGETWYSGVNPKFDQQWHQLVITYDENNVDPCNMSAQLYLDGALKGTRSFSGVRARLGPEMYHLLVGARNDIGYTYNQFAGYIDEFAIYAGILDPNRIMAHYSAWWPRNCADLVSRTDGSLGDMNKDCKVDFEDFATIAFTWWKCNAPSAAGCTPNW